MDAYLKHSEEVTFHTKMQFATTAVTVNKGENSFQIFIKSVLQDVKKATAMVTGRIDRIQEQIDGYQSVTGNEFSS